MTVLSFKQFVPSEVCLKCKGCCRYKDADSDWRPKVGAVDQVGLADLITSGNVLDAGDYIKTIQICGEHLCQFLNGKDQACGIYSRRPLECSLYPFIISKAPDALRIYVHLACPYIQDHLSSSEHVAYVEYLKGLFARTETREFLSRNKAMLHDYTIYALELLHLFDISPI